jgi:hypothetical protein
VKGQSGRLAGVPAVLPHLRPAVRSRRACLGAT